MKCKIETKAIRHQISLGSKSMVIRKRFPITVDLTAEEFSRLNGDKFVTVTSLEKKESKKVVVKKETVLRPAISEAREFTPSSKKEYTSPAPKVQKKNEEILKTINETEKQEKEVKNSINSLMESKSKKKKKGKGKK